MMQVIKTAVLPPDKFCFWLQGFAELHKEPPTKEQWDEIKKHLNMVFDHAQPIYDGLNKVPAALIPDYDQSSSFPQMDPNRTIMVC